MFKLVSGAAQRVFSALGVGFNECVYQKALSAELNEMKISHQTEVIIPIYYKAYQVGSGRADIVIMHETDRVILELKAVKTKIGFAETKQLRNYLHFSNTNPSMGMVINFPQNADSEIIQCVEVYNYPPPPLPTATFLEA
jgi:GxxExxY protein